MPDRATLVHAGWRLWASATPEDSPYLYEQGELMREAWDAPVEACPWRLDPLMNVCDVWWRPVQAPQTLTDNSS